MAVTQVNERWQGRTGKWTLDGVREYGRTFQVFTDDPADDAVVVLSDPAIPLPGSVHPSDAACIAKEPKAEQNSQDPRRWFVSVSYTNDLGSSGGEPDPLLQPPQIDWVPFDGEEPMFFDADGTQVANGAGDFYLDPPVMRPLLARSLLIERNEADISVWAQGQFDWVVNTDTFYGWAQPKTALCLPPRGRFVYRTIAPYWQVRYEVRIRDLGPRNAGWRCEVPNVGLRAKENGKLVDLGYGRPWPLTDDGIKLSETAATNPTNWRHRTFKKFRERALAPLGL